MHRQFILFFFLLKMRIYLIAKNQICKFHGTCKLWKLEQYFKYRTYLTDIDGRKGEN